MTTLREKLKGKLNKKEFASLVTSYDVIGDIAVIQTPKELEKKERLIGNALLDLQHNLKVVAKEIGMHQGVFRLQKIKVIAGEQRKVTECRENNVRIKLNIEKTYFSPRLSTERKRIMEQVKAKEDVLVMFSGIGPYVLVIAKNTKANSVTGIEINPDAHKYALENVKLNKLDNVKLYKGDVRLVVPRLKKKFDRICMPLPMKGEDFLDVALKTIKKKGIIHFYDFEFDNQIDLAKQKVKKACELSKKKCRILRLVKAGQVGPRNYRLCVDFKVF